MDGEIVVSLMFMITLIVCVAGVNIYFWNDWDTNIVNKLEAQKEKCEYHFSHLDNNIASQSDVNLINLESAKEDEMSKSYLLDECYYLINDFDFKQHYTLKKAHILRIIFSMIIIAFLPVYFYYNL